MLSGIFAFFKALAIALGLIERKQDRDIGAELQRGKDNADELVRVTTAINAGNDPTLSDPSGVLNDPNNRDRADTSGN